MQAAPQQGGGEVGQGDGHRSGDDDGHDIDVDHGDFDGGCNYNSDCLADLLGRG